MFLQGLLVELWLDFGVRLLPLVLDPACFELILDSRWSGLLE
jgi:hypothetical protein